MMKNVKAITLISLVITIVILIILAGIAINLSFGENGIFVRSKQAKEMTNKQTATEKINLKITTAQINKYADKQVMPTLKELSEVLRDDNEIQYVTEKSQIASIEYEVGDNPSSIFTKLNEFPYEFEINSSLQLASIDGIKIATSQDTGNGNSGKLFDYSNSGEKIIGTWYNGKTMYELSIPITIPSTSKDNVSAYVDVDLSSYNMDECIIFDGYFSTGDIMGSLPIYTTGTAFVRVSYSRTEASLSITNSRVVFNDATGYVTLHYTKK